MFMGWNDGSLDEVFGANMETPNSDSPKLCKICVQLCMPASPLLGVRAEMGISQGFLDRQSSQNVSFKFNKEILSSKSYMKNRSRKVILVSTSCTG